MSTFVLVHGAFSGAWCWEKVAPRLEELGHRVIAVDLPSHGKDMTSPSVVTMQHYTEYVKKLLENELEKVILVGHSLGGLVISQVAEYISEKIDLLVYVAALLPEDGQTFLQMNERNQKALPLPISISEDQTYFKLNVEAIKEHFYGECTEEDFQQAKIKHSDQALAPFMTPVSLTNECFGFVRKVYIETLKDRSLSIEFQREMYSNTPCEKVFTLDADHSPFLSQPQLLVSYLDSLSK
ncbi:alpha/beta fold hydrolase [Bacillus sp. CGMCC 1.16607]|uniref:alpha/beta fold hydrolase n=1 Tax=Bacillus sp. CGMCC 1.16607 TaxID=3351842 RepID=UPI00364524FF